jgi:hypothetical protein
MWQYAVKLVELMFFQELPDYGREIQLRNGYSGGNYPGEWQFNRNYPLMSEESTGGMTIQPELPTHE